MSLNMYLGEVRAQSQSMNALCVATIQGMEQAINSIDAFVFDSVLQGQTYDSAKTFFAQTFRTLAQGIIYLCEELIRQNDAFPNDFQSQVASTDVIEQEIRDQIRELEQAIAALEAMSEDMPGAQAMLQIYYAMLRKLQEKLEHLYAFNYTSSSNYDTALQLAASVAQGLAQVQGGKGFNAASGTFSIQELNMGWTASIQKITEDKARQAEEESKKGESLLDKFKDAAEDGIEAVGKIATLYHNYRKGQREAVIDELKGLVNTVLHPIDSFESAMYALSHLDETFDAVKQAISNSWNQDVVNGDWNSRAKWVGNVEAQAELAVAQLLVGTKGVDKISKLGTVSKLGEVSKVSKSVNFMQGVKNVMNSDKYRQFVDRLNNILMPKNQFAYAGGNVVDSFSDSTTFKQVKEKLSNYQFFKGKGTVKIDYDLAKDYIRDVESKTGLKLHKNQVEQLKAALREHKYEKMTPLETLKHRNKFNSVKNKLISEWEEKTGQTWPRYTEEVYDKKGRVVRDIGQPYDAHHIIENNFGGPHEWWNIHPAKFPDEHQAGIHGKGSPSNKLFPRR
ncbi:T7SS effector LXG polymorphic toxin [Bacillus sp. S14(2024)]|uniref:T7SS effector LXG polymorphic toxin n=1 Tax=Bacillus sp. S14(2024) TaxID=3162884 RepID=UPI003D21BD26